MLILFALTISTFNLGLDYILGHVPLIRMLRKKLEPGKHAPECRWDLYNPTIGCPMCFSSIYGSVLFFLLKDYFEAALYMWPIVCIMSVFTTLLLKTIKEKLDQ